jgi:hypothetical protein
MLDAFLQDTRNAIRACSPLVDRASTWPRVEKLAMAQGIFGSGDYFSTLGVHAVLGRTFTVADDRRGCSGTAVLTRDFWQKAYSGSAAVLERTISLLADRRRSACRSSGASRLSARAPRVASGSDGCIEGGVTETCSIR